jgi:hypothetical protein
MFHQKTRRWTKSKTEEEEEEEDVTRLYVALSSALLMNYNLTVLIANKPRGR